MSTTILKLFAYNDFKTIKETKHLVVNMTVGTKRSSFKTASSSANNSPSLLHYEDAKLDKRVSAGRNDRYYMVEVTDRVQNNKIQLALFDTQTMTLKSAVYDTVTQIYSNEPWSASNAFSAVHVLGVLSEYVRFSGANADYEEYSTFYQGFEQLRRAGSSYAEEFVQMVDSLSVMLKDKTQIETFSENLIEIDEKDIASGEYMPDEDLTEDNEWKVFSSQKARKEKQRVSDQRLAPNYFGAFDMKADLSKKELLNIKENQDWLNSKSIASNEVAHNLAKEMSMAPEGSALNELVGISGGGKSTIVRIIAALLNLPYTSFAMHTDTDSGDLLGQFTPNTDKFELPSEEDMEMFPDIVYFTLTGKMWDDSVELNKENLKKALVEHAAENNIGSGDFKFVKSSIAHTFQFGGVCDIQEPNVADPAVLVSLNSAFAEGVITLTNGEVIKRHENAFFIFTSNPGYVGTQPIQESVMSRVNSSFVIDSPSVEESARRVMAEFGLDAKDKDKFKRVIQMAEVVEELRLLASENRMSGVVDYRSLKNWVQGCLVHKDAYEQCIVKVINKMSKEEQDIEIAMEKLKNSNIYNNKVFNLK